jgi:type IV secretory pathway VirB2 component (pilin)
MWPSQLFRLLRRMRWRSYRGAFAALLAVLVGASACATNASGLPSQRAVQSIQVPLAGSIATATTSWGVVLMGKNDGKHDLFWQLFALNPATERWSLVTPRGVADNGGLSIAADPAGADLLTGFETSQGLTFSPLALTVNGGSSWNQGGLSEPLMGTPSSVALGSGNDALALVAGGRPAVLIRSGSLTSWSTLITLRRIQALAVTKTCGVTSLTAVAIDPAGQPLVGVSCRRSGHPGVLVESGERWHMAAIPISASSAGEAFQVLRLGTSGTTSGGLLAAGRGGTMGLVATWAPSGSGPWTVSRPLDLGASTVVATGTGTGAAQFVVLRSGSSLRAEVIDGPGNIWRALPVLPPGVATVAFSPSGIASALGVRHGTLVVWQLTAGPQTWAETQSIAVPISYGSSD